MEPIKKIIESFDIQGQIADIQPFGSGHINDSYKATTKEKSDPNYLIQHINHEIFTDVDGLMQNILDVTNHLKNELDKPINAKIDQLVLEPILTSTGKAYSEENGFWRVYVFLDDLRSYDQAQSEEQLYEGARAFGYFLRLLEDFPKENLNITIKAFHNIETRLKIFSEVCSRESVEALTSQVKEEINYVYQVGDDMCTIQRLLDAGKIPMRVTHNDTKFNNVLLDANNKGRCVIDLDTVMPGVVHYDYGDGIRSGASKANEDEQDLQMIELDLERFKAFSEGYLDSTRECLTTTEIETLARSSALFPFLMGVRFLTDYLDGNQYYKTAYLEHNLVRARAQLHLSKLALGQMKDLKAIIKKYS